MSLTRTYYSNKKTIIEALDEVDKFIDKMELFMQEHPNYEYKLTIKKQRKKWEIKLIVIKNE
jgi:hypothetical protein